MFSVPSYILTALDTLSEKGFEAFVVGGAVRDMLRGAPVHDYDVTTDASPDEIKRVFHSYRTVDTGIGHGTVTVLIEGVPVEITTYRIDGEYTDKRHPVAVTFTKSLKEDAARRDFTVNAMAYHPSIEIQDFFGGQKDLSARIIRTVGDPERRFTEDALRILRALRFASTLDFTIEENTIFAMRKMKDGLLSISLERVREELLKLLCGTAAVRVLREFKDILATVLPEIAATFGFDQRNHHHAFDLWEHTVRTVGAVKPTPVLRLGALLHDVGKPSCFTVGEDGEGHFYGHAKESEKIADGVLSRLRFDNKTREAVLLLIRQHDTVPAPKTRQFARLRSRHGDEFLFDWLALVRADREAQMPTLSPEKEGALTEAENAAKALINTEERLFLRSLAIGGDDLKKCGIAPGKEMGELLARALDGVLDGKVKNEKGALLSFLSLTPVECERKFLIRYPEKEWLTAMGAQKSLIEQTYLLSEKGVTERVRKRDFGGRTVYYYTKKVRISALSAEEYEKEIAKEEYEALLSRRDETSKTVEKERYALPFGKHILEIDIYPFWSRQAVLEVELASEDERFMLPDKIEIIREVSGEKAYKNAFLAKKIPNEEV